MIDLSRKEYSKSELYSAVYNSMASKYDTLSSADPSSFKVLDLEMYNYIRSTAQDMVYSEKPRLAAIASCIGVKSVRLDKETDNFIIED